MLFLIRYWIVIAALASACACASRSTNYRLVPTSEGSVLTPPGVRSAALAARKVKLKGLPPGKCPETVQGIALKRRSKSLRLEVTQQALSMRPNGWLLGWAGDLEASGCLPAGRGLAAARLVAQALPSSGGREYALLNSQTRATGRSDLLPWMKLRVTTPIFREGASPEAQVVTDEPGTVGAAPGGLAIVLKNTDDFVGYEIAWYKLEQRPDGGVRLELEFSETHVGDETTRQQTTRQPLDQDTDARYFRILVLTRISASDHNTAFLSARTLAELEDRTEAVELDPAKCAAMLGCTEIDTRVALLPFVAVFANGEVVLTQPGSTVRQMLREAGHPDVEKIAATLAVKRDYGGRLTSVRAEAGDSELLELSLVGGEAISFETNPVD